MIVSSLLLQTTAANVNFSTIFNSVKEIYNFLVKRGGVYMIMRQQPRRQDVLEAIEKLGFTITQISDK